MIIFRLVIARILIVFSLPVASSSSVAQSAPTPASSGASVTMPTGDSFKELAAQAAADKWLGLLDRGEFAKAWGECAQLFRQRVTRQQWIESLPTTRAPLGAAKSRKVEVAVYRTSMPGAPDGQYVTVRFITQFDKKADAEELITLAFEEGVWRPTGYVVR